MIRFTLMLFAGLIFGMTTQVNAQFQQRQATPSPYPQQIPNYQPALPAPARDYDRFFYALGATPEQTRANAAASLGIGNNYNRDKKVVCELRLSASQSVSAKGMVRIASLDSGSGQLQIAQYKFQGWNPQNVQARNDNRFKLVPAGGPALPNTFSLQPEEDSLFIVVPNQLGSETLTVAVSTSVGTTVDNRILTFRKNDPEFPVGGPDFQNPGQGTNQYVSHAPQPDVQFEAPTPIPSGWRSNGPQYTNVMASYPIPAPGNNPGGIRPPSPEPQPEPKPGNGIQMPQHYYLTTGPGTVTLPPPVIPPPTGAERSGLKSQPELPTNERKPYPRPVRN